MGTLRPKYLLYGYMEPLGVPEPKEPCKNNVSATQHKIFFVCFPTPKSLNTLCV